MSQEAQPVSTADPGELAPPVILADTPHEPEEPAQLPVREDAGLVESLLADRTQLTRSILARKIPRTIVRDLALVTVAASAVYGLSIGMQGGLLQATASAIKLPLVLLGSAAISLPVLHVACAISGCRLRPAQLSALVLQALAAGTAIMAGLAPLIVVLWLTVSAHEPGATGPSDWFVYRRVVLMGLAVAATGGLFGATRLLRAVPLRAAAAWSAVFLTTGLQLSWLLRPVVGMPGRFVALRPLESNALSEILTAIAAVLG